MIPSGDKHSLSLVVGESVRTACDNRCKPEKNLRLTRGLDSSTIKGIIGYMENSPAGKVGYTAA